MTREIMDLNLNSFLALVVDTIRQPKDGAQTVLAMRPSGRVLWDLLAFVVVVGVLLGYLSVYLASGGGIAEVEEAAQPVFQFEVIVASPLLMAVIQMVLLSFMSAAVYFIGRGFGGTGGFEDTLALMIWLQAILLVIQVAQTLAMLVFPALGMLIGFASVLVFLWLLVNFVALVHGFQSLGLVFAGILVSSFGLLFLLSMLMAMTGLFIPGSV